MTGFIADGQPMESPLETANQGYADTPPSEGERFSAMFGQTSITQMLGRKAERDEVAGRSFTDDVPPPLSADEANKQYGPIGPDGKQVKIADGPMDEDTAKLIGKAKSDELDREGVLDRASKVHSGLNTFAVGTAAFLADPLNLASVFIPGVGEETALAGLGRIGLSGVAARTGARVAAGATAGAASQIPLTALRYGLGQEEASDYALRDAFKDVAFAAAGGAILHAGFGAVGDAWKARGAVLPEKGSDTTLPEARAVMDAPVAEKSAAMKSSVSQIVTGREVDPASVLSRDTATLAEKQRQEYETGFAPGLTAGDMEKATDELFPKEEPEAKEEKSALPQTVVDRYKKTISDEAARLGIPLDDAGLNRAATAMAESYNPNALAEAEAPKPETEGLKAEAEQAPLHPEDTEIAELQAKIDPSSLTGDESKELGATQSAAAEAASNYEEKLRAWTDCLAGIGG